MTMARPTWLTTRIVCGCLLGAILLHGTLKAGRGSSNSSSSTNSTPGPSRVGEPEHQPPMPFGAFSFEVHGKVQGVFFRKFTVARAQALHLVGWCANTNRNTVVGECQGATEALQAMKEWLCKEGSPHSRIERCEFRQERSIQQLEYQVFERKPNVP